MFELINTKNKHSISHTKREENWSQINSVPQLAVVAVSFTNRISQYEYRVVTRVSPTEQSFCESQTPGLEDTS